MYAEAFEVVEVECFCPGPLTDCVTRASDSTGEPDGTSWRGRVCYRSVAKRWPRRYSVVIILLRKILRVLIPRNEA